MVGKKFLAKKNKKNLYSVKRRLQFPTRRENKTKLTGPDEFYGLAEPLAPEERMTTELMIKKKQQFIQNLTLTQKQCEQLELETHDQSSSQKWYSERRNRLTASNFGKIIKMRPTTSCRNTVYELLYNSSTLGKEPVQCRYGKSMEKLAIEKFENETNLKVNKCGLFIDNTLPYLGASPGINILFYL